METRKLKSSRVVKTLLACLGLLFVSINNETEQEFLSSLSRRAQSSSIYGVPTIE